MNMGVFPSGQWGQTVNLLLSASVVRIHPRPPRTPVSNGYRSFCFICQTEGTQGWIRTAAATSLKTAQKPPSGLFLAARLATSTRAHQKTATYQNTLRFCFTMLCLAIFASPYPSEKLCQNAVLNNKPSGGQGEGAAVEGGIPGTDAVLHKGQLCGGKLLAVQGLVDFKVKPFAQPQL